MSCYIMIDVYSFYDVCMLAHPCFICVLLRWSYFYTGVDESILGKMHSRDESCGKVIGAIVFSHF